MKNRFVAMLILVTFVAVQEIRAEVRLPKMFTDNAVLQRDMPIAVWGWADAGETVKVRFCDNDIVSIARSSGTAETVADVNGRWLVRLPAQAASFEPKKLVINEIELTNIIVGDVWICSGQSNMEQPLNSWGQERLSCRDEEITGDYSFVRFNRAAHIVTPTPTDDTVSPGWLVCKDGVQKDCTAVGFHFAVRLSKELGVPIGLIDSNWGGSNINSWIPDEGWFSAPELIPVKADYDQQVAASDTPVNDWVRFGGMYNGMLAPWKNYAIRGAIWYQGESNAGEREFYYFKQKAMIETWRKVWNQGDFPFYWVQLANFTEPSDDPNNCGDWPGLRDGQTKTLAVPNTGQAVIIDTGEVVDIHPRNKFDVGNRLALWALANVFGKNIEPQSPTFASMLNNGNSITLTFNHVGSGLMVGKKEGWERAELAEAIDLTRFAVAGEDKKWFWADAKIIGPNTVIVQCEAVKNPVAVRYAWQMNPEGANLYSTEGLPATPFRTDSW